MDETGATPPRTYDRHMGRPYAEPARSGCLLSVDALALFWPILLVLLALAIGTPIVAIVTGDVTSCWRYAITLAYYGGLGAVWLMVPWGAAYLLARVASLWIGSLPVLWAGFAGILVAVLAVATGELEWASLLIAIPSLSAIVSAAVRIQEER